MPRVKALQAPPEAGIAKVDLVDADLGIKTYQLFVIQMPCLLHQRITSMELSFMVVSAFLLCLEAQAGLVQDVENVSRSQPHLMLTELWELNQLLS